MRKVPSGSAGNFCRVSPEVPKSTRSAPPYGMFSFGAWLLAEERRQGLIDPGVLQGYEYAFRQELERLIRRTENAELRKRFEGMIRCPIVDSRSRCRSFSDYIVSALIKNGVHHRHDLEAALGYVVEKMLMPVDDAGQPRVTIFGGFEERPDQTADFNPLQARFLRYLQYAVNNVRKGKIPRLASTEQRPQGTISIRSGRDRNSAGISPDDIPARPSGDADLGEMISDLTGLLRSKEAGSGLPLVELFASIMSGQRTEEQRVRFGDRVTQEGRRVIVDTVREYARSSGNSALLSHLERLTAGTSASPAARAAPARAVLTDKERDYRSIVSVIARFDRPVGSSDLGRYRRRWLEYGPRDQASGFANRLEEVLSDMVRDGVLTATRTRNDALVYSPGPEFERYLGAAV